MIETQLKQRRVGLSQGSKAALERLMDMPKEALGLFLLGMAVSLDLFLQQVHDQRRDQSAREEVRCQQCEYDRFGQGYEQISRYTCEEEHRHKDDADAERRDEGGNGDLLGAIED